MRRPEAAKLAARLFAAGLLAATLAPVTQNWSAARADGFPFSYYPMFSRPLGETYEVVHVVGVDREGGEHVVPYRYLSIGGLNEVREYVRRAARKEPERFCERVAAKLRAQPSDELRQVHALVVRTGVYELAAFYRGRIAPRSEKEHARCRVPH